MPPNRSSITPPMSLLSVVGLGLRNTIPVGKTVTILAPLYRPSVGLNWLGCHARADLQVHFRSSVEGDSLMAQIRRLIGRQMHSDMAVLRLWMSEVAAQCRGNGVGTRGRNEQYRIDKGSYVANLTLRKSLAMIAISVSCYFLLCPFGKSTI